MTPLEWERACAALTWLVQQEYPEGLSLVHIASTWGVPGITPEQIDALRQLETDVAIGGAE